MEANGRLGSNLPVPGEGGKVWNRRYLAVAACSGEGRPPTRSSWRDAGFVTLRRSRRGVLTCLSRRWRPPSFMCCRRLRSCLPSAATSRRASPWMRSRPSQAESKLYPIKGQSRSPPFVRRAAGRGVVPGRSSSRPDPRSTARAAVKGARRMRRTADRAQSRARACPSMASTIEEPPVDGAGDCAIRLG
jgi:hypothetical protein